MTKLKKKDFLEQCNNAKLSKAVLKQLTASWWEIKERPEDFRNAQHGIGGFIYYNETEKFAKKNIVEILEVLEQFEEETCSFIKKDLNNLAWFALENTIQEVMYFIEE
jgi:hypothetical protein